MPKLFRWGLQIALVVAVAQSAAFAAEVALVPAPKIARATPEFEAKIVDLFSQNRCDEVREMVAPYDVKNFRGNILAIAAYCQPAGEDPEELFSLAEAKVPSGDLILVLHAKYRYKKDPEARSRFGRKC
jgi:hypothetical protein